MYRLVQFMILLLWLVILPYCTIVINGQGLDTYTSPTTTTNPPTTSSSDPPSTIPSDVPSDTPSTAPSDATIVETVNVTENIVGGIEANFGEYPFFVYPQPPPLGGFFTECGATLIHEDIVLTAAHCECSAFTDNGVYIGGISRDGSDAIDDQLVYGCRVHPDYDGEDRGGTEQNDIMLLKLTSPSTAPTVTLNWDSTIPFDGDVVTSIGFGATEFGNADTLQSLLRKVDLDTLSDEYCDSITIPSVSEPFDYFPETNVCAGDKVGGKCSANGDSGGPLLTSQNVQIGILSFGDCLTSKYTEVAAYQDFIRQFICDCSNSQPDYCETPPNLESCSSLPPTPYPTPFPTPLPPTGDCYYPGKGTGKGYSGEGKGSMGSMMSGKKCKKGMKTPKEPKTPKAGDGKMSMVEMKMMGMKYKTRK